MPEGLLSIKTEIQICKMSNWFTIKIRKLLSKNQWSSLEKYITYQNKSLNLTFSFIRGSPAFFINKKQVIFTMQDKILVKALNASGIRVETFR